MMVGYVIAVQITKKTDGNINQFKGLFISSDPLSLLKDKEAK